MVRISEIRTIKNPTDCQITYCNRKNSLIRSCHEISILCDVDVAFVAYSPTGRASSYNSRPNLEDIIQRYLDLSPDKRYFYLNDVEDVANPVEKVLLQITTVSKKFYHKTPMNKAEKLEQLDHIKDDKNKLFYLKNQIKDLELEIQKAIVERDIVNNKLEYFELGPYEEPTVSKLKWCEANLRRSLEQVKERKNQLISVELSNENSFNVQSTFGMSKTRRNPYSTQYQVQHDWLSQNRAKGGVTKYQNLHGRANRTSARTLNGYIGNHLKATTFPSGGHAGLNSSLFPETQFLSTNYSLIQNQPMVANCVTSGTLMHQNGGMLIGNSYVENMGDGGPFWVQNNKIHETCSYYRISSKQSRNMVAPITQFQVNSNEVCWTPNGIHNNTTQNRNVNNVTLPTSSDSGHDYESKIPSFTTTNCITKAAVVTGNNETGASEPNPTQVSTLPTDYTIPSHDHNLPNNQAGSEGNLEGDPLELGEIECAQDLDFEELASLLD